MDYETVRQQIKTQVQEECGFLSEDAQEMLVTSYIERMLNKGQ